MKLVPNLLPTIRAATKLFISGAKPPMVYQAEERQIADLFFLVGAVANLNGQKTAEQITMIQQVIELYLDAAQHPIATAALERGAQATGSRDEIVRRAFGLYFTPTARWLEPLQILDILLRVAMSDGNYTLLEQHFLDNVRRTLGVHKRAYWLLRDTLALRYQIPDRDTGFAEASGQEFQRYRDQMRSDTFGRQRSSPSGLIDEHEKKNHYFKMLELPSDTTLAQVKAQYRKLVKRYHPDTSAGMAQSEEELFATTAAFCAVQEAYQYVSGVLSGQRSP